MGNPTLDDLQTKTDAAWANLVRIAGQLGKIRKAAGLPEAR